MPDLDLRKKYNSYIDKKYRSKGTSIWVLQRRTISTAIQCIDELEKINCSDDEIFTHLFRLTQVSDPVYRNIISAFVSQVELLFSDKDKFAKTLHRFMAVTADKIKRENRYEAFFMALSFMQEYGAKGIVVDDNVKDITTLSHIILDMFMQMTEYIRPDRYDLNQNIIGITTTGELMLRRDPYPMTDYIVYLIDGKLMNMKSPSALDILTIIQTEFKKHGFENINSFEDIDVLMADNTLYANMIFSMVRFSNEYTVDMLPDMPYSFMHGKNKILFPFLDNRIRDADMLKKQLHKRRRTLPSNGIIIEFPDENIIFQSLKLKETYKDDSIILLFKFTAKDGKNLCGYYNTKNEWFWSPLREATLRIDSERFDLSSMEKVLMDLILWIYVAYVCDDDAILPTQESFQTMFRLSNESPIHAAFYGIGGKPQKYYDADTREERIYPFDKSKYEEGERSISGFVRQLPPGHHASEKAKLLAESLGFSLKNNETYVQPFIRRQWLKPTTNEN